MDGGTEVYGTLVSDIQTDVSVTGKPVYLTASGNDITVDVKKGNMIEPVISMLPIQDLNGYDKVWYGGAGKNKFDNDIIYGDRYNGTYHQGNNYWTCKNLIPILPDTTYTFSGLTNDGQIGFYDENQTYISNVNVSEPITFTTPLNAKYLSVYNKVTSMEYDHQLELGSTATTYEPYANVCPIVGRTKVDISVNGSVTTREYGQEIFGGSDDIANGDLTNEWVEVNITSASRIAKINSRNFYITQTSGFVEGGTKDVIYSDKFEPSTRGSEYPRCFINNQGAIRFNTLEEYDTPSDCFNAIGNIQFLAKRATPSHILLTKGYVPLDKGTNEITVSNNDIITFDYYSTLAGKISGTLSYIEDGLAPSGYLSGSGNFLALHLDSEDWNIYTSVKVGLYPSEGSGMVEILTDEEKICVGKITSNDQVFMVESTDGTLTKTDIYSLSDLVLETE